ncbi:unnamed protein product [Ceutorhynchus assimilis]|uniref:Essential MCU regulator, mitochondrial n=1 Tax=Ceutorhynchus assimilis TaxID=467358 RepID=A0A9N9MIS8_9CUCU|nr:unnamed protein product [Ceutorhynchus assimilis]
MTITRILFAAKQASNLLKAKTGLGLETAIRSATTNKHGIILSEPQKVPFGLLKVILTVVPGLLIGAGISKNIANFLEENDLFVPSDDDDDDD